ncbi:periodic tryptophan protein 1 homolog [Phtheirospermum japonicum]|uniref:Periodic tryptophan protein 1 homolog n=1 Tax=Phtheirospermum japonicum TaxID=374723 RepID=A0A830BBE4_9LAMI|nr:periodic tryptophan protein 1 homolog [Phtheirospermum japonicum]
MITAIAWVPKGASKSVPASADPPSKQEIEEILKGCASEIREESENEENSDDMNVDAFNQDGELARASFAADALGKPSKNGNPECDSLANALKELDMDRYDEEDDGVKLFGSYLGNLYYPSNDMDPYLQGRGDEDSEEEEDITIKPDDAIIPVIDLLRSLAANRFGYWKTRVVVIQSQTSMYTMKLSFQHFPFAQHGSILLLKVETGNFIAVGTRKTLIEIWDLDIMDEVRPAATLGGITEKKKKGNKKYVKYKDGSHTDSVLALAWNKEYRNIIASASADKLVKVHTVAWNHFAPQILLSGSSDRSVVMKDGRLPSHSGFRWPVAAEVESLAWDPHTEHSFVVSQGNGMVSGFDIRVQSKPSFTLHAHISPKCIFLLLSKDKLVKIWDLSNEPSCIASRNPKVEAVFSVSFSEDMPFTLAIGGFKGKLQAWDILSDAEVAKRYGNLPANLDKTSG